MLFKNYSSEERAFEIKYGRRGWGKNMLYLIIDSENSKQLRKEISKKIQTEKEKMKRMRNTTLDLLTATKCSL